MFIALCRCNKVQFYDLYVYVDLDFTGVAYGQCIKKIIGIYKPLYVDFTFNIKGEYVVYLEFIKIENNNLYGKIIYYQDFLKLRLKS